MARQVSKRSSTQQTSNDSQTNLQDMCKKTKLCRFYAKNACRKGRGCQFAHGIEELARVPDLRRTKMCHTWLVTGSCTQANCQYAHNRRELGMARRELRLSMEDSGDVENSAPTPIQQEEGVCVQPASVSSATWASLEQPSDDDDWEVIGAPFRQETAPADMSEFVRHTFIHMKLPTQFCRPRRTQSSPPLLVTGMPNAFSDDVKPQPLTTVAAVSKSFLAYEAKRFMDPRNPEKSPWGVYQPSSPPPHARKQGRMHAPAAFASSQLV